MKLHRLAGLTDIVFSAFWRLDIWQECVGRVALSESNLRFTDNTLLPSSWSCVHVNLYECMHVCMCGHVCLLVSACENTSYWINRLWWPCLNHIFSAKAAFWRQSGSEVLEPGLQHRCMLAETFPVSKSLWLLNVSQRHKSKYLKNR